MEPEAVTPAALRSFLQRLGDTWPAPAALYLLGGGALSLLGSPRETRDLDYITALAPEASARFQTLMTAIAEDLHLDIEEVPISEFVPLPPDTEERRVFVERFGQLDVYIFDPYTIALSKIARGFPSDLEDVQFMLRQHVINFPDLERLFLAVLPRAAGADIDPKEFRAYFEEVRRMLSA